MEFTNLASMNSSMSISKNICRTCLLYYDSNDPTMYMNIQDLVSHEMNKIKLIDILIFLNCLEVSFMCLFSFINFCYSNCVSD